MSGGTKIILLLQIFAALIHPNKVLFINILCCMIFSKHTQMDWIEL